MGNLGDNRLGCALTGRSVVVMWCVISCMFDVMASCTGPYDLWRLRKDCLECVEACFGSSDGLGDDSSVEIP